MRDQQVGESAAALQGVQQVEDLGLHRDVQGGGGFVQQDQLGLGDERPGDGDALPLAARELVGVAVQVVGRDLHLGGGGGRRLAQFPGAP
jgi:hypothetical protein